jgi:hypothetical protein
MTRKGDPDAVQDPDVEVGASVKAKWMRFRRAPKTDVDLHGEVREPDRRSALRTSSGSERENLPEEVEPGVAYRDVRVRWRAAVRVDDPPASEQQGD